MGGGHLVELQCYIELNVEPERVWHLPDNHSAGKKKFKIIF